MKYVITHSSKSIGEGRVVYRIAATSGELGGFVESAENLSQLGLCWLHGDSVICGDARVIEDAQIYGLVEERAQISGQAQIYGRVYGSASVSGTVAIYGSVGGSERLSGSEVIYGSLP